MAGGIPLKEKVWEYKKFICKAKCVDLTAGGKIVVLNEAEAHENDLYPSHRIILKTATHESIAIIDLSSELVNRGEIMLFSEIAEDLDAKDGEQLEIKHMQRPASIEYIKKKMDGSALSESEIETVMRELMENRLSEAELASFITSVYIRGMSDDEVVGLTNAVVSTGQTLNLARSPVCD